MYQNEARNLSLTLMSGTGINFTSVRFLSSTTRPKCLTRTCRIHVMNRDGFMEDWTVNAFRLLHDDNGCDITSTCIYRENEFYEWNSNENM